MGWKKPCRYSFNPTYPSISSSKGVITPFKTIWGPPFISFFQTGCFCHYLLEHPGGFTNKWVSRLFPSFGWVCFLTVNVEHAITFGLTGCPLAAAMLKTATDICLVYRFYRDPLYLYATGQYFIPLNYQQISPQVLTAHWSPGKFGGCR